MAELKDDITEERRILKEAGILDEKLLEKMDIYPGDRVRFRFRDHANRPVRGILYPSSALPGGHSCVLFGGHEDFTNDWTFGRPTPLPLMLLDDQISRRPVDTSVKEPDA